MSTLASQTSLAVILAGTGIRSQASSVSFAGMGDSTGAVTSLTVTCVTHWATLLLMSLTIRETLAGALMLLQVKIAGLRLNVTGPQPCWSKLPLSNSETERA